MPEKALRSEGGKRVVHVVSGKGSVSRTVRVGRRGGGFIEILEGLNEGDVVLVNGSTSEPGERQVVMIELQDINKKYQTGPKAEVHAVRGVSLIIQQGEFVAIMGPVRVRKVDSNEHSWDARSPRLRQVSVARGRCSCAG